MTALLLEPIGEVELLSLVGERLTVRAPRPLPPGTRVTLRAQDEARRHKQTAYGDALKDHIRVMQQIIARRPVTGDMA